MADRKTVARSAIQRLNQLFEDAPEVDQEEISRLEAVRLLARNIHRMTAKGYSAPAIVKIMAENGVPITAPTLKTYLAQCKTTPAQKRRTRAPTTSGNDSKTKAAPATRVPATDHERSHTAAVMPDEESWDELKTPKHNDVKGSSVASRAGESNSLVATNTPSKDKPAMTPPTSAAPRLGAAENAPGTAVSNTPSFDPFKNRETRLTPPVSPWLNGRHSDSVAPPQRPATSDVVNGENTVNGPVPGRPRNRTNG
jgi:hypothetical protein